MAKEMIISVNGREKKIAILDNGRVTEFYIERGEENSGIAGNIYKGRVQRVLPGMQSAFVSIGLERDAFLYVSDFFDEEEEIERIVMEKSRKVAPEDAKREAQEQVDRKRVEREKQMESVQEIAEPITEEKDEDEEPPSTRRTREPREPRGRGRTARDQRDSQPRGSASPVPFAIPDDSGFERIIDDEETPGDMFKDAFVQERIVDQVRAVEFEMESTPAMPVGALLGTLEEPAGGFERIADEDDVAADAPETKKGRGRAKAPAKSTKTRAKKEKPAEGEAEEKPARSKAAKAKTTRSRSKKAAGSDASSEQMPDGEAGVRESDDTASMTVRRGGRGRRRGGRRRPDGTDAPADTAESDASPQEEVPAEIVDTNGQAEAAPVAEAPHRREPAGNGNAPRGDRGKDQRRGGRSDRPDRRDRGPQPTISDLLREGQEILVQIAKEPIARKGARITSHIALPGRFLVYMPTIEHLGVSRKIESSSERARLRTLIQRIKAEEDVPSGGFIVRTAGIGISEEDLRQDARYLVRTWTDIKKTSEKAKSPALVHQDLDIVQRLLRDQMSDEFTAIRVDSEEEYLRTVEFVNRIQPRMVHRVKLYTREQPILEAFGVQEEIEKALKPRVWLKSGGYLVINQTEALVAIDVNTGKFVGKGNARLEDTITKTNLEAVDEIARQIRLRDLGGIIVLDLIDMEDRRNRNRVSQALQEALASDKSPTKVLSFNDFGLIIMTRKRVKQSLERTLCTVCEYCEGSGWVKSPQTVCFEILSDAARMSRQLDDVKQSTLRVHPEVAKALRSSDREIFDEIEALLGPVDLTADPHIHQAQFDFAFV
jgi:ribonuclease G